MTDTELLQHPRNDISDDPGHIPRIVRVTVWQIVIQITYTQLVVPGEPLLLSRGKGSARNADRIVSAAQRVDIVRLIRRKLRLRFIQFSQQL